MALVIWNQGSFTTLLVMLRDGGHTEQFVSLLRQSERSGPPLTLSGADTYTLRECLASSFEWSSSIEGHGYWETFHNSLDEEEWIEEEDYEDDEVYEEPEYYFNSHGEFIL